MTPAVHAGAGPHGVEVDRGVEAQAPLVVTHDQSVQGVSAGQSPLDVQPTQRPAPSHLVLTPQGVFTGSGGLAGTPVVQTFRVHALPSSFGSVSSLTLTTWPLPSQAFFLQSPVVCSGTTVPCGSGESTHLPLAHERRAQGSFSAGQSVGASHSGAPPVPPEAADPPLPPVPTIPALPAEPALPNVPELPALPALPTAPALPTDPDEPALPAEPASPPVPAAPLEPEVPRAPPDPVEPSLPLPVVPAVPAAASRSRTTSRSSTPDNV